MGGDEAASGVRRRLPVVLSAVAAGVGIVLLIVAGVRLKAASDDLEATEATEAELAVLVEETEAEEARQAPDRRQAARLTRLLERAEAAARDVGGRHRGLAFDFDVAEAFEQAVGLWSAGDHAGAVALADDRVPEELADKRSDVADAVTAVERFQRRMDALQAAVG